MNDRRTRILLIEDNPGDARLIEHMLEQAQGLVYELTWVDNLTDGIAHLQTKPTDVLLLDLGLPESSGLDTLQILLARVPAAPTLVVLSGLSDENIAVQAVQSGAQDYLVKGHVDTALLVRSIRYAIERSQARQALRQANDELERRVVERTAELANTIEALHAEIAERKQAEERIRYMAHHDALTGLPNRELLQDRLTQAIAYAHRNRAQVAVLFIGLDYFKHINDSLGHKIGDHLLQMVAARLQECLREGDSVARSGDDVYVLCLPLLAGVGDAALVAQKALDALNRTFLVEGNELHASASIGISLYPDDGADVETLMRAADTAMNHAKERERGSCQFFTQALNDAVQQRLVLEKKLRQALAKDEFVLYYQPQVDMANGAIFSCEALLRWRQPGNAPITCGDLIAIAEETGLILPLGEWLLREACRQLKQWQDAGHPALRIAVNLSPRQFYQPHLLDMIVGILDETGLAATSLELEITESLLLQRSDEVVDKLNRLSAMGIQLSVDDFGTGYSSLAYLQRFPVHALKIDQAFVREIDRDQNTTALVTAIIAMANSLHMKVLAEGVETEQQIAFLLAHGCPSAQGFYYSEALTADAFIKLLNQ
ncbi:MAG: EAL domain-containing protein [Rhodoferax sp.]|nr:EAL domain-containing protein [Rhodoferax sp.]